MNKAFAMITMAANRLKYLNIKGGNSQSGSDRKCSKERVNAPSGLWRTTGSSHKRALVQRLCCSWQSGLTTTSWQIAFGFELIGLRCDLRYPAPCGHLVLHALLQD